MIKILLASDSFKGTLSSKDIIYIAQNLVKEKYQNEIMLDSILISDGGEGFLDAISSFKEGKTISFETFDAEYKKISIPIYFVEKEKSVYIESASIIGLPLLNNSINPLERTSKGIGIAIKEAISLGANNIYIGLGGTSTNDLGIGMLEELGIKFPPIQNVNMKNALKIKDIDLTNFIFKDKKTNITCFSDVKNSLLGKNGSTYVFGKQKGYSPYLEDLENKMEYLTDLFEQKARMPLRDVPSLGAAGGLATGLYAFANAKITSGIDAVLSESNFEKKANESTYVITGEGHFDSQSLNGKVVNGIIKRCPREKIIILCGKSEIKDESLKIFETPKNNEPFEGIKAHAKDEYSQALDSIFLKITDKTHFFL